MKQQRSNSQFTDVPPFSPEFSEDLKGKGNKIVAVIDSIVSNPGVLLPWQEMVRVAHEEGVWTVIDAAHSVGQEVRPRHACRFFLITSGYWGIDFQKSCSLTSI